jgi:hypothetical protein
MATVAGASSMSLRAKTQAAALMDSLQLVDGILFVLLGLRLFAFHVR